MDMARVWPIIVEFGGGAVLCAIGVWCGIRSGSLDLSHREDKRLLLTIVGGFVALLALYAFFTFIAPNWPAEAAR